MTLAVAVLGVVLLTADVPEVGTHGRLAACSVLLGDEGCLVGRDVLQVVSTLGYHCTNGCETSTNLELLGGRLGSTLGFLTQIQAVTLIALGRGYAVRAKEHFST